MTIHVTDTLFHLRNDSLSYIMQILPNGYLGQLYVGPAVPLDVDYSLPAGICGTANISMSVL